MSAVRAGSAPAGIVGVVLAGGLGRRMAQAGDAAAASTPGPAPGAAETPDKGLRRFRGRPMIAHAIERLAPQVDRLIVNANRNVEHYEAFGWPVVEDRIAGYAGPLAGLHAAMHAAGPDAVRVASVPCDSPFLPLDLVERLADAADRSGRPLAVARADGRLQPVFLLAEVALADDLESWLAGGGRRIDAWLARHAPVEVPFDDQPDAFRNINTPDELQRYE